MTSIRTIVFQYYIVFMVHVLFEFLRITNQFEIGDWNIDILYGRISILPILNRSFAYTFTIASNQPISHVTFRFHLF